MDKWCPKHVGALNLNKRESEIESEIESESNVCIKLGVFIMLCIVIPCSVINFRIMEMYVLWIKMQTIEGEKSVIVRLNNWCIPFQNLNF
jgi:hypothetical protein